MKPPIIYTLLGCTLEISPGGRTATASWPGGERRTFTAIPGGASAQVQAQRWVHDYQPPSGEPPIVAEAATDDTDIDDEGDE